MSNIEQRVRNIEVAIIALISVSSDHCAPALSESLNAIGRDLFEAAESLGGPFLSGVIQPQPEATQARTGP